MKFTIADAKKLSEIIETFGHARTRANHTRLLLMMFWTCDQRDGGTTSAGASELAKLSGVSVSQAQRFLESGERGGWLRRVGTKKTRGGEFVVREIVGITDRREESESVPMPVIDDGRSIWLPPGARPEEDQKDGNINELVRRARAREKPNMSQK